MAHNYILIVDDSEDYRAILREQSLRRGLVTMDFDLPSSALEHLLKIDVLPYGYLVDMRIQSFPPDNPIPKRIYEYVQSRRGPTENFYFMTAHISHHDREVIQETGAKIVLKEFGEPGSITIEDILDQWANEISRMSR